MSFDAGHALRIRELFREEAAEHVETIHAALREARRASVRADALERALRAAHSLKGGAAIAGMSAIAVVVHDWESCAGTLLAGKVSCDDEALDVMAGVLDGVSDVLTSQPNESKGVELADLVALMREKFGAHCHIRQITSEPSERDGPSSAPTAQTTVRVATERLERQMAGIEELLRLNVGAEQRLRYLARTEEAFDLVRSAVRESRQLARSLARGANGAAGATQLLGSLDALSRLSDAAAGSFFTIASEIRQATHTLSSLTDVLHTDVRALRMLPLEGLFAPFERALRDLCRRTGKRVSLRTSGGSVEVDRDVIEAVKDPLLHLIRNAVDHGIEHAAERLAAGKPEDSVIQIHGTTRAGMLEVELVDDGRGVDARKVGRVAIERRLVSAEQLSQMNDDEIRALIFHDGFSTASEVTELSGRGVGLAVVRNAVERLGGRVSVATREGIGTSFKLLLPLNLTTSRLLLVEVSGELFAIPAVSVERVLRVDASALSMVDHGFAFDLDGRPVGVHGLAEALGLGVPSRQPGRHFVVVLGTGSLRAAFVVDRIVDELPLVARSLGEHLADVAHVSGAAILADGSVAPILNVSELVRAARSEQTGLLSKTADSADRVLRRVLVVDDSVTTRTLEKSILEAAGYEVEVATDGSEALERLERRTFDLVLSDVQMPRVDGLALTRRVKQDPRWSSMPVVLVSSLDTPEQKKEGLDAGADAYLGKADFEQGALLATLERFL